MPAKTSRRGKVVDCHGHVKWYGYDADRLVENMDAHGIDVMWLLTWEAPREEAPSIHVFWPGRIGMPLGDVVEAVARHPRRFVPFYAPDPRQGDALAQLKGAVEYHGVRGFGELKVRIMMDDPRALELFWFCGEKKLPVTFHLDIPANRYDRTRRPGQWYCAGWENLARTLELCPETIFLGHAPGFWKAISGDAHERSEGYPSGEVAPGGRLQQYLDRYPNLYCDLSAGSGYNALSRDPAAGKEFLLKYQDRCLFGRDYFDDRLMKFIKSCNLPKSAEDGILGGNALKLVPL